MKIPRDISGGELAKILSKFNYQITRQTGSHIRLTTYIKGEHHITVPHHNTLKIGTLNSILVEISAYLKINKQNLILELFK